MVNISCLHFWHIYVANFIYALLGDFCRKNNFVTGRLSRKFLRVIFCRPKSFEFLWLWFNSCLVFSCKKMTTRILCPWLLCQFLTITRIIWSMDFDDPQVINDSRVFDDLKVHIAFDNPKAFCDKSMVSMVLLYKIQRLLTLYIYQSFVEMKKKYFRDGL